MFKFLRKKITVIIIPHSTSHPIRSSISNILILFMFFSWVGALGWAGWIISKKVNYSEVLKTNDILRRKTEFLTNTLAESRDYLEQVKEIETKLKGLLSLKSKKDIIESAMGGPSVHDKDLLAQIMMSESDFSQEQVDMNFREMKKDSWNATQNFRHINDYIEKQRSKLLSTPCIWPANGTITSRFGWRTHPLTKKKEFHKAIDIANEKGLPIRATADGKVVFAGWQGSYGRSIMLDHGNGFSTRYCHNSILIVKPGQQVKRGQVVSLLGSTGRSTGPHVHYEVWYKGEPVNPTKYLAKQ